MSSCPFDPLDDVGAATMPLLVELAARWLLDRPPGRAALVACGSKGWHTSGC